VIIQTILYCVLTKDGVEGVKSPADMASARNMSQSLYFDMTIFHGMAPCSLAPFVWGGK
jgi:hypothetical protein